MKSFKIEGVPVNEYRWIIVTMLATFLFCWASREILERIFGLTPRIRPTTALDKFNRKLTRPLDSSNVYRMTGRGTVHMIQFVWKIFLLIFFVQFNLRDGGAFLYAHFIEMDPATANNTNILYGAACIMAYYIWEILTDRYGRLAWPLLAHHMAAIFGCATVLMGVFNPFALWFGFIGLVMTFPNSFSMAFRFIKSNEYPALTRKLFVCTFYHYLVNCIVHVTGQLVLVVNGYYRGFDLYFLFLVVCLLIIFGYDDFKLLKALRAYGFFEYEKLDPLVAKNGFVAVGDVKINVEMQGKKTDEHEEPVSPLPVSPASPSSGSELPPSPYALSSPTTAHSSPTFVL